MSKPFIQWSDDVDQGDDFVGPWPDWEPLNGGDAPAPVHTGMAEDEIDFEPDWSAVDGQT